MAFANYPEGLYDSIIDDREYPSVSSTMIPVRESVIDRISEYAGTTEIRLDRPDGGTHILTGEEPIPERDELLEELAAAQQAFGGYPVSTLKNLHGDAGRLGPLHYTNQTAHFTVGQSIHDARPQHGTGPVPEQFQSLGVKAAHLAEGFEIASALPYHWVTDLGWSISRFEVMQSCEEGVEIPEDRSPSVDSCFIINVAIEFPAQRFGDVTAAPAEVVNSAISETEQVLDETLLTKRMAQLGAIEREYDILLGEVDRGNVEIPERLEVDTVVQKTLDISESAVASLRSQRKKRRREAFQTVRRLSDSDDFNYVMGEFAETIDELGELAILGTKYREEVLDESPGFY